LFNLTRSTNDRAPGQRDISARRSKRLIVFVPGLGKEPSTICELYERLRSDPAFGRADDTYLFAYAHEMTLFSRGDTMAERCAELANRVASFVSAKGDVNDVILIGHSIGGLMVREAYLLALSGPRNAGFDWAQRVSRIVLLASLNAGFDLKRLKPCRRLLAYALTAVPLGFAAPDALASSPFMGSLRTRWMEQMAALGDRAPIVVQLLGNADQKVAYRDSLDVEGLPRGAQRALPKATHEDIVRINDVPEDFPGQRYEVLRWAILGERVSADS
jgi:pimeloyl-ACP methyl ester carboxylesterase